MLFDSSLFGFFLPFVFLLYWFLFNKNKQTQNLLLLVASYGFYACWDWRFLFLLTFSILLNYFIGLKIDSTNNTRKLYLIFGVIFNLGVLGFFKYYNFFVVSFNELLHEVGFQQNFIILKLILPVGISFYTFHGLSYIIDIFYKKIEPTRNVVDYALFVSYFPLLVAGPIERARHLLPQLEVKRKFNYLQATEGLKQMLWGFFKKIAIADACAVYVNDTFSSYEHLLSSQLLLGAFCFTIQIYCDFSGYSDIALGVSKLFGINLLKNFNYPYFSRNIAEFWRKWHISLSSWFKDYLYIPLGGSRCGLAKQVRNTFVIFIVSGLWHGANWTFILWGALNALFILPSIFFHTNRKTLDVVAEGRLFPNMKECGQMLLTFILIMFAWIIFRAENITHAVDYILRIFTTSLFQMPNLISKSTILLIIFLFVVEWFARSENFGLEHFGANWPKFVRWGFYIVLMFIIMERVPEVSQQFIYFQF